MSGDHDTSGIQLSNWAYVKSRLVWLREIWRPNWRWIPLLVGLTFLSAGVTMAYPLVFGYFVDALAAMEPQLASGEISTTEVDAAIWRLLWILLAIGIVRFIAGLYPGFRALINNKIDLDVRTRVFARVTDKGHRFFAHFRTGDLVTRLVDDILDFPKIAWWSCSGVFRALESGTKVVLCLGVMLYLDPRLALLSLIPLPLTIAAYLMLRRHLSAATRAQRDAASDTSAYLESAFSGVTILQARNAERWQGDAFHEHLQQRKVADLRLEKSWVTFGILFQSLNVLGQIVIISLGGMRVIDGSLSVGTFVTFYLYLEMILAPLMDLPHFFVTARQAFVCMDRIDELDEFDRGGEGGALRGTTQLEGIDGLAAEGIRFRYLPAGEGAPASAPALDGLDLRVRRGEKLAVVGRIGAGKSTLTGLLAGVFVPDSGSISASGHDYGELDAQSFRSRVGLVPQDPVLFSGTLRENILVGRDADDDRLQAVIDVAGLTEEVASLTGGDQEELGLRGLGLSGGQRQRLAIARALYGEPELLLLDDITAALDAENEERFWQQLESTWPELSAVVVTHRPATARRLDRILVLDRGKVVASGTHDELVTRSSHYQEFLAEPA